MKAFLAGVAQNEKLTQGNPKHFWATTELLEIQQRGASQREMVALLRDQLAILKLEGRSSGGDATQSFVYLDDAIFTGSHLLRDLTPWIQSKAPEKATVYIVSAFIHTGASYRATNVKAKGNLKDVARQAGKQIIFEFWRIAELENRVAYSSNSDVLRPKEPPNNRMVQAYVAGLQSEFELAKAKYNKEFKLNWRTGDQIGTYGIFSSAANRAFFEEQLLIAGCEARLRCSNLIQSVRPLGYEYLTSLGFGRDGCNVSELSKQLSISVVGWRPLVSVVSASKQTPRPRWNVWLNDHDCPSRHTS